MTVFALIVFVDMVAVLSGLAEVALLQRAMSGETITLEEADLSDQRQAGISLLHLVVFVAGIVSFLMWFHRAHKNLETIEVRGLKYSARWAVWSFFIPILNLFRPFQIARETWKASAADDTQSEEWSTTKTPAFLKWWWALFLTMYAISPGAPRADGDTGEQLEQLLVDSSLAVVSYAVVIPAAILAMLFVHHVTRHQRRLAARPPVPAA